jgi:hypothetical protein
LTISQRHLRATMTRSVREPERYWAMERMIVGERARVRTGERSGWKKDRGERRARREESAERGRGRSVGFEVYRASRCR